MNFITVFIVYFTIWVYVEPLNVEIKPKNSFPCTRHYCLFRKQLSGMCACNWSGRQWGTQTHKNRCYENENLRFCLLFLRVKRWKSWSLVVLPRKWISYVIFRYKSFRAKCLFQTAHEMKQCVEKARNEKSRQTRQAFLLDSPSIEPYSIAVHLSRSTHFRFVYRLEHPKPCYYYYYYWYNARKSSAQSFLSTGFDLF